MIERVEQHKRKQLCCESKDLSAYRSSHFAKGHARVRHSSQQHQYRGVQSIREATFRENCGETFAIFLDNLSLHKTNLSKELFKELQVDPIFNLPYSPQLNGIESYFCHLKNEYKSLILQKVKRSEGVDFVNLKMTSIEKVDDKMTIQCVKNGYDCLQKVTIRDIYHLPEALICIFSGALEHGSINRCPSCI